MGDLMSASESDESDDSDSDVEEEEVKVNIKAGHSVIRRSWWPSGFIVMMTMIVFLERHSLWNLVSWAEQEQIQNFKTHAKKIPKTACIQTVMLKYPTKQ